MSKALDIESFNSFSSEKTIEVIKEEKVVETTTKEVDKKYVKDKAAILRMSNVILNDPEEGKKRGREESFVIWNELESLGFYKKECEEKLLSLNLPHKTKEDLCNQGTKKEILMVVEGA